MAGMKCAFTRSPEATNGPALGPAERAEPMTGLHVAPPPAISRSEWRWAMVVALAVVTLSFIPYAAGYLSQTSDSYFAGTVYNLEDYRSYQAKMWLGYRGEWQYHSLFTPEDHPRAYFYLFYIVLGHLARLGGLSLPFTFQLARFVASFLMLLLIYRFMAFFAVGQVRRVAFVLACTSSGLGWAITTFCSTTAFHPWGPLDFWFVDLYVFFSVLMSPHFAISTSLLLLFFMVMGPLADRSDLSRRDWLVKTVQAALLTVGLGLIHPHMLLLADAVAGLYFAFRVVRQRRVNWRPFAVLAAVGLSQAPVALYSLYFFTRVPFYQRWLGQTPMLSPSPLNYFLGYGLVALLAIGGLAPIRRARSSGTFLFAWLVVTFALAYLPTNTQRRFVAGIHIAVSLLAAYGLVEGFLPVVQRPLDWLSARLRYPVARLRWWVQILLVLFASLSTLYLLLSHTVAASLRPEFLTISADDAAAMNWLAEHATWDETLLSTYDVGGLAAARIGHRVVLGHWPETMDAGVKQEQITMFYTDTTPPDVRSQLLDEWGVHYVYYGPRERDLGTFQPDAAPDLQPVFHHGEVSIYRVVSTH